MSAITFRAAVDGDAIVPIDPFYAARTKRAARRWGAGRLLVIRIEPEDEAWRHSDVKFLYGYLYGPVSRKTGETVADVHLRFKASDCWPDDGRTSLTQLNREEMKAYIEAVSQDIREHDPDSWADCVAAMSLFEERRR